MNQQPAQHSGSGCMEVQFNVEGFGSGRFNSRPAMAQRDPNDDGQGDTDWGPNEDRSRGRGWDSGTSWAEGGTHGYWRHSWEWVEPTPEPSEDERSRMDNRWEDETGWAFDRQTGQAFPQSRRPEHLVPDTDAEPRGRDTAAWDADVLRKETEAYNQTAAGWSREELDNEFGGD